MLFSSPCGAKQNSSQIDHLSIISSTNDSNFIQIKKITANQTKIKGYIQQSPLDREAKLNQGALIEVFLGSMRRVLYIQLEEKKKDSLFVKGVNLI